MAKKKDTKEIKAEKKNTRHPNRNYLLYKLDMLKKDGMEFPDVSKDNIFPSKEIVKHTKKIIESVKDDDLLYGWDISLYANGSIILYYYKGARIINAMVNIADLGASGIYAFRDVYYSVRIKFREGKEKDKENIDKIIEVFRKTAVNKI